MCYIQTYNFSEWDANGLIWAPTDELKNVSFKNCMKVTESCEKLLKTTLWTFFFFPQWRTSSDDIVVH